MKTSILWISDIHLNSREDGHLDNPLKLKAGAEYYFESFLRNLESLFEEIQKIDYLILSGDIVFSGLEQEYDAFSNLILKRLKESKLLKDVKILTCPGNHDILWENANTDWFKNDILTKLSKDKIKYLDQNETIFHSRFIHYTNFFKTIIQPSISNDEINESYKKNGLYGYYKDPKAKILFIILNSAWYSLGNKINELLLAQDLTLENLLYFKAALNEYGGQTVGNKLLSTLVDEINSSVSLDFKIITIVHHPPSYFHDSQLSEYEYDYAEYLNNNFNKILSETNLLLTGHLHYPYYKKPNSISHPNGKTTTHLQAQMFLPDTLKKPEGTNELKIKCGVSFLEILDEQVIEKRFYFSEAGFMVDPDGLSHNTIIVPLRNSNISTDVTLDINYFEHFLKKTLKLPLEKIEIHNFRHGNNQDIISKGIQTICKIFSFKLKLFECQFDQFRFFLIFEKKNFHIELLNVIAEKVKSIINETCDDGKNFVVHILITKVDESEKSKPNNYSYIFHELKNKFIENELCSGTNFVLTLI